MTPDELETLSYDKPPKQEAWYRRKRAHEALKEFLELFYVEATPLERIFMLTFVSWCCKWIPETGYAYLLKAIVTHFGPTDTLTERPALWNAILEPMPTPPTAPTVNVETVKQVAINPDLRAAAGNGAIQESS